jgi:excinuclease ABC subunit C
VSEPTEQIRQSLEQLPALSGCYLFRGEDGEVLYVGKAKSLRPRVRSYFQRSARHPPRIASLVQEVRSLDFIVTSSEIEALVLENNLIKEHRPRFNVLLRDDKNFPYLKLTMKDDYPRVTLVRRPNADGQLYFGPFLPAGHARRTLRMIPRFFQVANCHLPFDGKQRPCLYYHLDQCLAPCAGKAEPGEYRERAEQVRLFLEGRNRELRERIEAKMAQASEALAFEQAARYRDMLRSLERLSERSQMSSTSLETVDFWAEHREGSRASVELFRMREGRVVGRREFSLDPAPEPEAFYDTILVQYYADEDPPPEIVLPRLPGERGLIERFLADRAGRRVQIKAPTQGERRRLLDLVARNAELAFEARFRARHVHTVQVLEELRDLLGLDEPPYRLEGFDVSHSQGSQPRASMVVFEGGKPKKSDYRSYRIRTAEPGDDYQAMREVVGRRYARLQREGRRLPDLVLIDGGKGQLAAAQEAVHALGLHDLPMMGLAKREEEIFLQGRGEPVLLSRDDPSLHLIQQVRDEAHRFAVRHHRKARSRSTFRSALTDVPGIGPTTARRLLEQFGSVEGVRCAPLQALRDAVGPSKAAKLAEALQGRGE